MPTPAFAAGQQLGEVVGQLRQGSDQKAYVDQLGRAYDTRRKRAQAILDEARADSRTQYLTPASLAKAGIPAEQVDLAMGVLGTADTPNLHNLDNLGDFAVDRQREEALSGGNVQRYNQLTQLKADKEYQPVRAVQGNLLPSGVGLGDDAFEMVPLPQTLATIEQKEKLGEAALVRANRPPAARSSSGRKPSAASADADILTQARARIAAGANPKTVADYLRKKGYPGVAKKLHDGK